MELIDNINHLLRDDLKQLLAARTTAKYPLGQDADWQSNN